MDSAVIKSVLIDQKEFLNNFLKRSFVERSLFNSSKKFLKSALIKVIIGARRSGKSVFAFQLLKDWDFAYINFDDEQLIGLTSKDLNSVLSCFYEIYSTNFKFVFLDEIQNIAGWELFVNRLHRLNFNVIVSGSNALLLSRELATHLTGRHLQIELFPFSFKEFLIFKGIDFNKLFSTKDVSELKVAFNVFMLNGGFPEIFTEPDARTYLSSLYSTIITKDVLVRHKIKFEKNFKEMALYLISNSGNLISYNKLKNVFNLGSDHTAKDYVGFLEEAYVLFSVLRFSNKLKESFSAPRKVYCIDTGLLNAIGFKTSFNHGSVLETLVAIELLRNKSIEKNYDFYYWTDPLKNEVDFVVKQGIKVKQLIQVCYDVSNINTKEREVKALIKANKELKCNSLIVITFDFEKKENFAGKEIEFIPIWKWLLRDKVLLN